MTPAFQLYMALRTRDTVTALRLINESPDILSERMLGRSWLHYAAEQPDSALVAKLIALGANLNDRTDDGLTPLDKAAMYGQVDIAKQLLGAGATIQQTTPESGGTLIGAVNSGSIDLVRGLLDHGADPHIIFGSSGTNALNQAVACGHHEIATLLRSRGCELPPQRT